MSNKRIILLVLVATALAYVISEPVTFGICEPTERFSCIRFLTSGLGKPLFLNLVALLISIVLTSSLKLPLSNRWAKFTSVYFIVAGIWIAFTPTTCGGYLPICLDRLDVSWLTAGGFFLISLILIITQKLKAKPLQKPS